MAKQLVAGLKGRGLDATYFYGHRLTYLRGGTRKSLAIAFKSFWRHMGRALTELERHRLAKALFDLATTLDYIFVLWRLGILRRRHRIVVVDRYVADVIAYLRFLGPSRLAEPALIGISFVPDLPILFDIPPSDALARKQEQTLAELQRYAKAYESLRERLGLIAINARPSADEVLAHIEQMLVGRLVGTTSRGEGLSATSSSPDDRG